MILRRRLALSTATRLFLTVWLVYVVHFASDVVRETYLAIALGEKGSVRVDEYLGLHPDLFAIEGRGAYINNNPGASMVGAVPYALARPAIGALFALKPELARPKPRASYSDPRPLRERFMNEARARGLDIKLGLAALVTQAGAMAPLGALAAVLVFWFVRARLADERHALALALLYALATPAFFRSAFLNQNALIAHCVLGAYLLMAGMQPREADGRPVEPRRLIGVGLLLGLCLLCDYSGAPLALVFGLWAMWDGWGRGGARVGPGWGQGRPAAAALASGAWVIAGAAGPIAALFAYQAAAFGSPWFPAQRYMPPTEYSVHGWNGMTLPTFDLLWRHLLDPAFGLFLFSPMLAAALAAPFLRENDRLPLVTRREMGWALAAAAALWLFSSANLFAYLQKDRGVRYLVPCVPLLFPALAAVLRRLPRPAAWALVASSLVITWSVSMTRESVPDALRLVFTRGLQLPFLNVLRKTGGAYASAVPSALAVYLALGVVLWLLWRRHVPSSPTQPAPVSAPSYRPPLESRSPV